MPEIIRIKCPASAKNKQNRIDELFHEIDRWVSSEELTELVFLFGGRVDPSLPLNEKIQYLNNFANVWDYRNGKERWDVYDNSFAKTNENKIMPLIEKLGLRGITEPCEEPDYILPLGGARLSNLYRCQYAAEIYAKYNKENIKVVALSGKRVINPEVEGKSIEQYAPGAKTEFDAINKGLEQAFNLEEGNFEEDSYNNTNPNLCWAIRKYKDARKIYSIAAASPNPARRANSMDTFEFFMKKFNINEGDKLLLVTSTIYVPFQYLKFMQLALENNLYIDCVGVPDKKTDRQFSNTSNYLQETKAAINAIHTLAELYL